MDHIPLIFKRFAVSSVAFAFLVVPALAQQSDPASQPPSGWRSVDDTPPVRSTNKIRPVTTADYHAAASPNAQYAVPVSLTIPAGTIVTIRLSQALSSDHNQAGDTFSGTLERSLLSSGLVVAQRGQLVEGHVVEAKKAGMVQGVSHLGVELTGLTLADGSFVPIRSQLISWRGPTSVGRDVAGVATTTALGASLGAAAGWGTGAAIGAGAGAAAGLIGVLLTRGHPTVIYPESVVTFRLTEALSVSTEQAPDAFHRAAPADYAPQTNDYPPQGGSNAPPQQQAPPPGTATAPCGPYGCAPAPYPYYPVYYYPYAYAYPYPYYGYYGGPYFWGPSFSFFYGGYGWHGYHGYYGHGGGFHGGFHGGGHH